MAKCLWNLDISCWLFLILVVYVKMLVLMLSLIIIAGVSLFG